MVDLFQNFVPKILWKVVKNFPSKYPFAHLQKYLDYDLLKLKKKNAQDFYPCTLKPDANQRTWCPIILHLIVIHEEKNNRTTLICIRIFMIHNINLKHLIQSLNGYFLIKTTVLYIVIRLLLFLEKNPSWNLVSWCIPCIVLSLKIVGNSYNCAQIHQGKKVIQR